MWLSAMQVEHIPLSTEHYSYLKANWQTNYGWLFKQRQMAGIFSLQGKQLTILVAKDSETSPVFINELNFTVRNLHFMSQLLP